MIIIIIIIIEMEHTGHPITHINMNIMCEKARERDRERERDEGGDVSVTNKTHIHTQIHTYISTHTLTYIQQSSWIQQCNYLIYYTYKYILIINQK